MQRYKNKQEFRSYLLLVKTIQVLSRSQRFYWMTISTINSFNSDFSIIFISMLKKSHNPSKLNGQNNLRMKDIDVILSLIIQNKEKQEINKCISITVVH